MKRIKWLGFAALALFTAVIALWVLAPVQILLVIAWVTKETLFIEENHPVVWQAGPPVATEPAGKRRPNVVLILADDLGFNDISLHGGGVAGGVVDTPHINSIASQGAEMINGYAGNATCAPSRASIMTGRYASRFGFEFTPAPVGFARVIAKVSSDAEP